ncbi:MAG: 4Fe-4S double cluster binding domain-containing protein [Caldicoprobacteraceae bacterium]
MGDNRDVYKSIRRIMDRHSAYLFGIADISYSYYYDNYKRALVIAVPHKRITTTDNYVEEEFENLLCEAREKSSQVIKEIADFCRGNNIKYHVPPMAQKNEETLIAPFSYKYAAVYAGLGWIGKNDLLVTEEYGPRVRLSAILIDCSLPAGKPIFYSRCDDECRQCVEACPYNLISGVQWDIGKYRDELIDYHACNTKRSLFIKRHGRKNACGLCMAACPLGSG